MSVNVSLSGFKEVQLPSESNRYSQQKRKLPSYMSGGEWANCGQDTAIVEDWPCAVLCCVYASLAERCSSSKQFLDGSLMVSKRKRKRVNRIMVMMRNWRLSEANGDKTTRDEGFFFSIFCLTYVFRGYSPCFFFFLLLLLFRLSIKWFTHPFTHSLTASFAEFWCFAAFALSPEGGAPATALLPAATLQSPDTHPPPQRGGWCTVCTASIC